MSEQRRLQDFLAGVISLFLVAVLHLWSATWRKDISQIARIDAQILADSPVLIVLWHGTYFPLFTLLKDRRASIIVSQSFRGAIIEKICQRLGYEALQIPATKRGKAYSIVKHLLQSRRTGVLVLDGPLGPHHRVKHGAIKLAADLGFVLMPISVASSPRHIMSRRWDKREIPYPFAKVAVTVGNPFHVPEGLGRAEFPKWERRLKLVMDTLDDEAAHRLRTPAQ